MKKTFVYIALAICAVAGASWAVAQDRSLAISATRAEAISAAPDGGAWVLTTQGVLMFCKLEQAQRVQCYDKNGSTSIGY
jgi:hypothetical protein